MRFVTLNYHLMMGVCDTRACPEVGSGAGAGMHKEVSAVQDCCGTAG